MGSFVTHRDISAGNILVYPRAEVINGQRVLRWVGLSTDWELSKKIDEPPMSPQLERAGTWQFMSYRQLSNSSKVFELSDDLESFFYVILYFAIRYLDSNCPDVATYIEEFFDCYTVINGVHYIGATKKYAINNSQLTITVKNGNGKLTFTAGAMNDVILKLLKSFSAHYKVLRYEESRKAISLPPAKVHVRDDDNMFLPDADLVMEPSGTEHKDDESAAPTEEERTCAKDVVDHSLFISIIRNAVFSPDWHKDWKDQISATWVSLHKLGPPATGNWSKKQKTESYSPALFQATSEPPRTPSRTSSSKRGSKRSGRGGRGQKRGAPSQQRAPAENQHQMSLRPRKP